MKLVLTLFVIVCFCLPVIAQKKEDLPKLIKRVQPSVVQIVTYDQEGKPLSQGSGFFISTDGAVITNKHVMEGYKSATIKTYNGQIFDVTKIIKEDPDNADIIEIGTSAPNDLSRELLLSSSLPELGESIVVIGSPLGLEQTVSDGIVSGLRIYEGVPIIQMTAPISPGSSGGPVFNMRGTLIGIATFQSTEGQNLNFAISSRYMTKFLYGTEILQEMDKMHEEAIQELQKPKPKNRHHPHKK